jgi:hypothetical protein
MMEHEFVIQDIDTVLGGLKVKLPDDFHRAMDMRIVQMADHFYTVAELLAIPDKDVEALAEQLSTALLNKQVKDAWYSGKGRVFIRGPELWSVYLSSGYDYGRQAIYKPDEVPTEWRRQLGMLQLLNNSRTLLKDCGYRHTDKVFYLMEDGHGDDT